MIKANKSDIEYRKQFMLDAMPEYYQESPEVNAIMYANAQEIERKKAEAEDLLNQLFVRTATWGLDYWDRVLALKPAPRMPVNQRRERILAKLRGTTPATIRYLTNIINAFTEYGNASIEELAVEYRFNANIPSDNFIDTAVIREAINEVKPAHLQFGIQATVADTWKIKEKEYTFPVPYPVTDNFTTEPVKGIGSRSTGTVESKTYANLVPYQITGTFYCTEGDE